MSEAKFCFKHPTSIAKRKCFECARPLCPQCQIKLDHHLFCSETCHKVYARTAAARTSPPYGKYALYAASMIMVVGLVYFALFADAFYNGENQKTQPTLSQIAPSLPLDIQSNAQPVETILITRPINGMKSASQTIEVEGKAPNNAVVALYLNGTLVESTVARTAVYRFPQAILTKHANVIQTRFYTDGGSSNSSSAIMVFFQNEIAAGSEDWRFFQNSSDNISRGNLGRKEIVLTFDGGSEANSCQNILNVLKQYHVRSTMFLTGEFIEKYPDLTRRIALEHEVGNHTYGHEHLTTYSQDSTQNTAPHITREQLQQQLRRAEEVFFQTTGRKMLPLWRAPYGEHNLEIRRWAAELGYTHVAWTANPRNRQNMDSLDWVPSATTPGYFPALLIKDRLLSFGQNEPDQANGAIILMHLGSQRELRDRLDKYLPEIIKTFRQRGYEYITASELIDHQDLLPNAIASRR